MLCKALPGDLSVQAWHYSIFRRGQLTTAEATEGFYQNCAAFIIMQLKATFWFMDEKFTIDFGLYKRSQSKCTDSNLSICHFEGTIHFKPSVNNNRECC